MVFEGRTGFLAGGARAGIEAEPGPTEVEGDCLFDGEILDGPAVELDEAAVAGDGPSAGDDMSVGVAVGAGHGDEFTVRIDGDPGADIGGILADFGGVAGGSEGVDFQQSQHGGGSDQSGEYPLTTEFYDGVGLVGEAGSHFFDATVADEDRRIGQDRTRGGEDPTVLQEEAGRLGGHE